MAIPDYKKRRAQNVSVRTSNADNWAEDKSTLESASKKCETLFKATKKASNTVRKMHDQIQKHWDDWESLADEIIGMQGDKKGKGADQDKALTELHKRAESIKSKIVSIQKRMNGEQKAAIETAEKINEL